MNNNFIKLFISDAGVLKDNGFTDITLKYNSNGYDFEISLSAVHSGKKFSISKKYNNTEIFKLKHDIKHYDIYQLIRKIKKC